MSEKRHALIVATARYADPKLRQLRAPAADAERLAEVLRDPGRGDFAEVEVLADESEGTITRRLARFFDDRRPDDLLLLHFSCHGVKDDHGELFLAAADTEVDLLSATGVSAAWVSEQIARTRARRTIVLLDCCFSGSFPFGLRARAAGPVDAPAQLQGRGRVVITASSALEYAFEGDELTGEGRPSVFTAAVVEGLESGRADLDGDGLISVDELYEYVYDRVKERTPSQTPNMKSELQGQLFVAKTAAGVPLPQRSDPALPAVPVPVRGSRRRLAVAAGLTAVAGAIVTAAVVLPNGGGGEHPQGGAAARATATVTGIPAAARPCGPEQDEAWMVGAAGAGSQTSCTAPSSSKLQGGALTYGHYASAAAARHAYRQQSRAQKASAASCGAEAEQALVEAYGDAATCFVESGGTVIEIYWNPPGSRLFGALSYDAPPATPADVVAAWHTLV
jgi:hypothetical protein